MDDRELLERAGRAAGIERSAGGDLWSNARGMLWSPLTDDGDALRLAVKLRMKVEAWFDGQSACARADCQHALVTEPHYGDDPGRALRRAIVRAAAELAKEPS